ncbi:hypothetical protein ABHN84_20725 [Shewanella vesiculosa]|uniref:Uncharacterized protein n=1 Tax=Shewanella vesiculosa TaxID=518738 RepID=A0ABV0FXI2_9GAMM
MSEQKENKGAHGGSRPGAGRKTKYEKTVVMRVPEQYKESIKSLIVHLDECERIDSNYTAEESQPVFIRSLKGKPQHVTFKVSSIKQT